jgi:hypothetical protein
LPTRLLHRSADRALSGDCVTASCAYTINHPATTTKLHATNLFCDIDHTTIARIPQERLTQVRASCKFGANIGSRCEFSLAIQEKALSVQGPRDVAGFFVVAVTGAKHFLTRNERARRRNPPKSSAGWLHAIFPRRKLVRCCLPVRLRQRSDSTQGSERVGRREEFRTRRVGENPGVSGIELGKSVFGDPRGLLRVIQRVV